MTAALDERACMEALTALGLRPGDVVWVHSSLRSLGPVEGGAATVVGALERCVGADGPDARGAVLMPVFNLVDVKQRAATWDRTVTPSTVGYLTEYFRTMPGTVRSDHYSHSVAARGARASWYVEGHRCHEGPASPWDLEPWGTTYGTHSPFQRLLQSGGKVLMLGVDYHSATFMHLVEVLHWNERRRHAPEAPYCYLDRDRLGAWWDSQGSLRRGRVGQADCRLLDAAVFVEGLLQEVRLRPAQWFKYWKE
jgi:aminoglycoside 3-N-acetyltransferase